MNNQAKQLQELAAALVAIADEMAAEQRQPAPPQDGPTEGTRGWLWTWHGAVRSFDSEVAQGAHANGLWAPTREACEALGSRLIMQAKRGPMPKPNDAIVYWSFLAKGITRGTFVYLDAFYWLGLLRIDSPDNRAELEQTLKAHGRGYGLEVGS